MTSTAVAPGPGISAPTLSAGDRWRAVPRRWRMVVIVVVAVVGVDLASSAVSGLGSSGQGASGPSSAYDASASGTEAFAQLLVARGYTVVRLTVPLDRARLPDGATLFVLDPATWTGADTTAVAGALHRGGRVVLGGPAPGPGVLRILLAAPSSLRWRSEAVGAVRPLSAGPLVRGITTVVSPGSGSFVPSSTGTGPGVELLGGPGGVLAVDARASGTLVLLASSSPLRNGGLGDADNSAFALNLAGAPRSTVVFDEYDHGFGRPGAGLAGLPASWRWGLGIALLAVVVWILSAIRRFGPPEEPDRVMIPARVHYVDAMATLLSTRPIDELAGAVAPVRDEARRRLWRRLGLAEGTPDDIAADALRQHPEILASVGSAHAALGPQHSAHDLVALGTALSQLDREGVDR